MCILNSDKIGLQKKINDRITVTFTEYTFQTVSKWHHLHSRKARNNKSAAESRCQWDWWIRVSGCLVYGEAGVARGKQVSLAISKGPGIYSAFYIKHSSLALSGEKVTC